MFLLFMSVLYYSMLIYKKLKGRAIAIAMLVSCVQEAGLMPNTTTRFINTVVMSP